MKDKKEKEKKKKKSVDKSNLNYKILRMFELMDYKIKARADINSVVKRGKLALEET